MIKVGFSSQDIFTYVYVAFVGSPPHDYRGATFFSQGSFIVFRCNATHHPG